MMHNGAFVVLAGLLAGGLALGWGDRAPAGVVDAGDRSPLHPTAAEPPSAAEWLSTGAVPASSAEIIQALANEAAGPTAITGATTYGPGGVYQVRIHSIAPAGFPKDGDTFLVISSGDASYPGTNTDGAYDGNGRSVDDRYGLLFDLGGLDLTVAVPSDAQTLEFNLRYFTVDGFVQDPVLLYLVADGSARLMNWWDNDSEFTAINNYSSAPWSKETRRVKVDVSAYRGRTVTLRLVASDEYDQLFDSGVAIDDLSITREIPVVPPPLQVGVDVKPAEDTATFSLNGRGSARIKVVVFGGEDFDVTQLDLQTATLGNGEGKGAGPAVRPAPKTRDENRDGRSDLVLFFDRSELIDSGALTRETASLVFSALLRESGREARGADGIRTRCAPSMRSRCGERK